MVLASLLGKIYQIGDINVEALNAKRNEFKFSLYLEEHFCR